jgi:hypothetical protein
MIAKEMALPWRAVEAMHWQMGQEDMASRANVPVFQPHVSTTTKTSGISKKGPKGSRSPPTALSDSSVGMESRARSDSAPSLRRRADSRLDKTSIDSPTHMISLDETGGSHGSAGAGSATGGSVSGRDWGEREREGTGTSQARSRSSSPRSPATRRRRLGEAIQD